MGKFYANSSSGCLIAMQPAYKCGTVDMLQATGFLMEEEGEAGVTIEGDIHVSDAAWGMDGNNDNISSEKSPLNNDGVYNYILLPR